VAILVIAVALLLLALSPLLLERLERAMISTGPNGPMTPAARLRCGEPCSNICCITMKSGTIRAKAIGSCFLRRRRQEGTGEQCSAGNDWAAC
jgi:hypothetical protein